MILAKLRLCILRRFWPHCRISSRLYLLWWFLFGRVLYKRVHGHDWHSAVS